MALSTIRYVGLGLVWIVCFYLSMEYWQREVPTTFAWICIVFMCVGVATTGNMLIRWVQIA